MEIRGNLDIHELVQIRGGNPNNEYILTSSDAEGNSLWRQHWFLTKVQWDEWENSYNESEATQNKVINTLNAKFAKLEKEVDSLDDNYVTSGEVNVKTQELIFTDKNGEKFTVTNSAALFTDTDTYVMSGEYNPEMGEVTFLTNMDTTFKVTGFAKELTDTFTDSASLDGNTLTFLRNNKETYDVDLSSLTNEDKHLVSGSISGPNRCVTQLNLLMSDDTTVPVDISNIIRDSYVHQMELDNDTNILTLRHADGMGCDPKNNVTVDLSSLKSDDDNTNSSIWTETIESSDNPRLDIPVYSAFYNKGHIGIGTDSPENKLHIEGSGFDNSAIRFLNKSGGFNGNSDYWLMGSRSFSSGSDGFEIGRKGDSTGGKLYITNNGKVSIGNGYQPSEKLEVNGNTLITNSNSTSDILTVESSFSNLTYGGASGEGTYTNNLILKHKNKTIDGGTTSSIRLKSAGDEPSISLTSHYTDNGTKIQFNAIEMNAGDSKVNIISADNNAEDAILSIQADESISFQSSIDNASSWPNDSKKTMTIDLINDKVVIDGGFTLKNGSQGAGKVLTSDANGLSSWQTPSNSSTNSGEGSNMPVGSIIQFAGDTAPDGWLMCNGASYTQNTYSQLYQVISNTYDKVSENGKFQVPNLGGRVPVGKSSSGSFNSLNKKGGVESVTLSKNQVPFLDHTHTFSDSNSGDSSHYHPISWVESSDSLKSGDALSQRAQNVLATKELSHLACESEYTITGNHGYSNIGNDKPNHDRATTGQPLNPKSYDKTQGRHTHTLSDGSDTTVGGGTSASSHTNVQPYIVLNYIIYYGVKSSTQPNNDPERFDGDRPGSGHQFG